MGLQPAQDGQHIDLAEKVVLEPQDDLVLLFVVAEGSVFLQGLFDEPGFGDLVIFVQELEAGLPERFAAHGGKGLALAEHFPPGDDVPL